jgi:hypothetical protein
MQDIAGILNRKDPNFNPELLAHYKKAVTTAFYGARISIHVEGGAMPNPVILWDQAYNEWKKPKRGRVVT